MTIKTPVTLDQIWGITDAQGLVIACPPESYHSVYDAIAFDEREPTMREIVRIINAHAGLVAALRQIAAIYDGNEAWTAAQCEEMSDTAKAGLAAAQEETP